MENCEPLAWYGTGVLALVGCAILIPYLQRKSDLITAWNILLAGVGIFLGIGCLEAAASPVRFHGLTWFSPTADEVSWMMVASSLFIGALFLTHYFDPVSRGVAKKVFNKWPPVNQTVLLWGLGFCVVLLVLGPLTRGVVFLGPLILNLEHKAAIFACVFSMFLWLRSGNLMWLLAFAGVFLAACAYTALAAGGRRLMLSVFLVPVIIIYYSKLRYWRPTTNGVIMIAAAFGLFCVTLMYSSIRHFDRKGPNDRERNLTNLMSEVRSLGSRDWYGSVLGNKLFFLSQQAIHYSLLCERWVDEEILEVKTLNTLKFFAAYPIPRKVWAGKPKPLGGLIGTDVIPRYARNKGVRWGCGIAGHAVYEGGLWVAVLYGYLAAFGVRLIDDPLARQPTNPFLLGILASAAMHIIAFARGDFGIMGIESIECVVFAVLLSVMMRVAFGTERQPIWHSVAQYIPRRALSPH